MKAFPVVHVRSPEQAVEQTQVAVEANADGVFLIHHGPVPGDEFDSGTYTGDPLLEAFNVVTEEHPDLFVGINYLGLSPLEGYEYTQKLLENGMITRAPNALWFDDATDYAKSYRAAISGLRKVARFRAAHPGLQDVSFMGGVSFKYTNWYTDDPEQSARMAKRLRNYIDVVTTSGAGTGSAPSPEKIAAMSAATGPGRLAVASGISIENIEDYGGEPDLVVLVASSLETESYSGEFVPSRVNEFVDKAHQLVA